MVDILKSLPHVPTSFPLNTYNIRYIPVRQEINLPYISNISEISQKNRINNINTNRWIGDRRANPPRLLDVSNTPYTVHRKIMHQELSRHCPSIVDVSRSTKSKQQRSLSKDTTKITTSTIGSDKTNSTSQPSACYSDLQSSRLFDTLSKHVTVKAEPLRSSNSTSSSEVNTVTSWQKYWTSTHAQRRRKEASEPEPEPILYRPKCEQSTPAPTPSVALRESPYTYTELDQYDSQRPSTPPNTTNHPRQYNWTSTPAKKMSTTKDDDISKALNQISTVSTIEFVASTLIPSTIDINSSIIPLKSSTAVASKSTDKYEEKYFTDKSLLLSQSSFFISDSQIIEAVSQAQIQPKPIPAKLYRFPIPSAKARAEKQSPSPSRTRSKSASKRKRQVLTNLKPILPPTVTIRSRSKYSQAKWSEPYIGSRFDPPPPPCSPSLYVWRHNNDQEDNDTSFEQSKLFDDNVNVESSYS